MHKLSSPLPHHSNSLHQTFPFSHTHQRNQLLPLSTVPPTMSTMVATREHSYHLHKKAWDAGSGELDVFDAARYFAGQPEVSRRAEWGGRKSLDMPVLKDLLPSYKDEKQKKSKQPSSPGGRLASFLTSLFTQSSSKKKSKSMKDKDESPGGRRRRSSISHFRGSSKDSKSLSSSAKSGFRTPPPCAHLPSPHLPSSTQPMPLPNYNLQNLNWVDEKVKSLHEFLEKKRVSSNGLSALKSFETAEAVDDGMDSDSSSDLFELQNYDLGVYSNDLPVYKTTKIDCFKRGAAA